MNKTKPYDIPKQQVWEAYKRVKAARGSAGIDEQSMTDFEKDLKGNLYKIWNRMSSGSYVPPPVKRVSIEKKDGGQRHLGVPTISDRIAQMVVKISLELCWNPSSTKTPMDIGPRNPPIKPLRNVSGVAGGRIGLSTLISKASLITLTTDS